MRSNRSSKKERELEEKKHTPRNAEGAEVGIHAVEAEEADSGANGWRRGDADEAASVEDGGGGEEEEEERESKTRPDDTVSGDEVGGSGGEGDRLPRLGFVVVVCATAATVAYVGRRAARGVHSFKHLLALHRCFLDLDLDFSDGEDGY